MSSASDTVLILRTGAIGDVVLTFPLVLGCIEKYGKENVTCAAPGGMRRIAFLCGIDSFIDIHTCGIHALFSEDVSRADIPETLNSFSIILNLLDNEQSTVHNNLAKTEARVHSLSPDPAHINTHAAEHFYSVLPSPRPEPHPTTILKERITPIMQAAKKTLSLPSSYIVIHPGTGSPHKRVNTDIFETITAANTHCSTVFITGPADQELVPFCKDMSSTYNALHIDSPRLEETAAVIYNAEQYIGLDSGISHIAACTPVQASVIFTTTDPDIWQPFSQRATVYSPDEIRGAQL